ncbi:Tetratricopeptide repeat-containing protein [Desulfosarcina cetonica]|uniref:tetratricopeptide repeat protein n=1 Tax=Desulfosarcina cetonica TaxID=90730 RepID=UPI0006D2B77F|nr:tetratricopeptide repeat protein [Desulfosarcina cetonica]VTR64935.1 Tetratricopeptide repeat-containing protein [Desulfosarcina cetonica]
MTSKKIAGYVKSENVIWLVVAALLVGFVSGVAFGIYKVGMTADARFSAEAPGMDAARQQTVNELKTRVKKDPKDLDGWIQLGHQYFDTNQMAAAIDAYQKALALDDRNANVWTDLGVMYRRNGELQKAVKAFDRAIAIDPKHEISRFNKGIVLLHDLKDEKGALETWEALLAINPQAASPGGQTVRELVDHIKNNHQEK